MDKAGAYGIQERACLFAESFEGDFYNIIGLPIAPLYPILKDFSILPDWQK
jgi:septum formation protein